MRPEKKPKTDILVLTPVWGAYPMVQRCIEHLERNTDHRFYHVLLDDNYPDPLINHVKPNEHRAIITVNNDPPGMQHVEQIGKMCDLGLAFGRAFTSFKWLVKLETDVLVQPHWDTIMLKIANQLNDFAMLEAYSVDVDETMTEEQIQKKVQMETEGGGFTRNKIHDNIEFVEMNLCLFSQQAMNYNWMFSMVPHSVDVYLTRHLQTMSGDLFSYTTKDTHVLHYRSSSRRNYS